MVNITEIDGIFTLNGERFDLKIDNNRKIYIKNKSEKSFNSVGSEIPLGYSSEEKKKYLYNLYLKLNERFSEVNGQ